MRELILNIHYIQTILRNKDYDPCLIEWLQNTKGLRMHV
jgi:hypothetical protein